MMNSGYVGIDVSKGYSDFVVLDDALQVLTKPIQFDDTRDGHQRLIRWLGRCMSKHNLERLYAGVESTGGFEDNWYASLMEAGKELPLHVARLNPSTVKNAAKASLSLQTTDALSAVHIARYLVRYADEITWDTAVTKYRSFRSFDGHIRLLVRQRTQLIIQFRQLLYSCFPELQRFCKHGIPNWVLELLKAYPSPQKLSRARAQTVAKINFISLEKATRLINNAKQTVAARGHGSDEFLIASMARQIQKSQNQIAALKKKLVAECFGEQTRLLETINGIGPYSAASLMIQIEDIRRFASAGKLSGYFGVYPCLKESGDKRSVVRMSKKGRAAMRATLYMCANSAVLKDPHLKAIYHRHRDKNKSHKQALGVVMHKLLRIIWGVLSSETGYDPAVDQANQLKKISAPQNDAQQREIASKRREQPFDEAAPISRIATQKRKVYQLSQVSKADQVRDLEVHPKKDKKISKNVFEI
jgi:transposase